jgi:hypothetical protein
MTTYAAVTLQSVTDWIYERTENHHRSVPVMDAAERSAWVELNHRSADHPLSASDRKLLHALSRKLAYRARYERF